MCIIWKWPITVCLKGVMIYSTLKRSLENLENKIKKKTNYRKNESDLSQNFFTVLSQSILCAGPKGLIKGREFVSGT